MITTLRAIHFGMAEMIENEKVSTIITSLSQVINVYHKRWFQVSHILGNIKFE